MPDRITPRIAAVDKSPARPRIAAALAEQMALITGALGRTAALLAELAVDTPAVVQPLSADGPQRLWTPQQIATAGGVGYETVLGWIHSGSLAAIRNGPHYLVPDAEWERFVAAQIRAAAALAA